MPSISYRSDGIEWVKFGKLALVIKARQVDYGAVCAMEMKALIISKMLI